MSGTPQNCKHVYVVTCTELGWDCIVGVFDPATVTREEMELAFPEKYHYVIFEQSIQSDLGEYKE